MSVIVWVEPILKPPPRLPPRPPLREWTLTKGWQSWGLLDLEEMLKQVIDKNLLKVATFSETAILSICPS